MSFVVNDIQGAAVAAIDWTLEERWFIPAWFALYTRSRHEKFIHHELQKKGIRTFLPLRKVKRQWSDRKIVIEEPLFKGYLFVHTPLIHCSSILHTKGAVRFVGSYETPIAVPPVDILALKRFMEEEVVVDPFPYLKVGEPIRVKSGPFKGVEGFVVRKGKNCRLVISLDMIMQSVSIEIDEACIELV